MGVVWMGMAMGIAPLLLQPHRVGGMGKPISSARPLVPAAARSLHHPAWIWRKLALSASKLSAARSRVSSSQPSAVGTKQSAGLQPTWKSARRRSTAGATTEAGPADAADSQARFTEASDRDQAGYIPTPTNQADPADDQARHEPTTGEWRESTPRERNWHSTETRSAEACATEQAATANKTGTIESTRGSATCGSAETGTAEWNPGTEKAAAFVVRMDGILDGRAGGVVLATYHQWGAAFWATALLVPIADFTQRNPR